MACPFEVDHSTERRLAYRHRGHCRERVNDGVHQVSFDDLVTPDRAACESAHRGEFRLAPPWLTINCFVIRTGDRTVLVDSGFAGKTEHVGRLAENLKAMNVAPADVDTIVMTHMHPDHEAGLTDSSGKADIPEGRAHSA